MSAIPTKLNQPPPSSPRTLETNRRRLGSLFSSMTIGGPFASASSSSAASSSASASNSKVRDQENGFIVEEEEVEGRSSWLSYLTPTKARHPRPSRNFSVEEEERVVDTSKAPGRCYFLDLPDELLIAILLHLPPTPSHLLSASLASKRLHWVAQASVLWHRLFTLTPGFELAPEYRERVIPTAVVPSGRWIDDEWTVDLISCDTELSSTSPSSKQIPPSTSSSSLSRVEDTSPPLSTHLSPPTEILGPIPVHYSTLYRSKLALQRSVHASNLPNPPTPACLEGHHGPVYALAVASPWLVTASRDRSVKFWLMPELSTSPSPTKSDFLPSGSRSNTSTISASSMTNTPPVELVYTLEDAHESSVLSVQFDLKEDGSGGTLVTSGSDIKACVWDVTFIRSVQGARDGDGLKSLKRGVVDEEEDEADIRVKVEKIGTLRGHISGVLHVVLSRDRIVTCSKDCSIRVYNRATMEFTHSMVGHTASVNCLSLQTEPSYAEQDRDYVISAGGDGVWIKWDMATQSKVLQGGAAGRHKALACVTWSGPYIVTGDGDRLIMIYDSTSAELLRTIDGHLETVRAVAVDLNCGIIVSGSYDTSVATWRLDNGELIQRWPDSHMGLVLGVAVNKGRVISVSHDRTAQIVTYGATLPYRGLFA